MQPTKLVEFDNIKLAEAFRAELKANDLDHSDTSTEASRTNFYFKFINSIGVEYGQVNNESKFTVFMLKYPECVKKISYE
jgi:hypothetical protein